MGHALLMRALFMPAAVLAGDVAATFAAGARADIQLGDANGQHSAVLVTVPPRELYAAGAAGRLARACGVPKLGAHREKSTICSKDAIFGAPQAEAATLIVVPQVNRELDKHKNESSDSVRQQKAELVIRQFEEFARRGDTISGVPIAGRLRYREEGVDVEPDPEDGLHVGNDDDHILANILNSEGAIRRRAWCS